MHLPFNTVYGIKNLKYGFQILNFTSEDNLFLFSVFGEVKFNGIFFFACLHFNDWNLFQSAPSVQFQVLWVLHIRLENEQTIRSQCEDSA